MLLKLNVVKKTGAVYGLPGGCIDEEGVFTNLGELAYWWSHDSATYGNAILRYIDYKHTEIFRDVCNSKCGFSVRLVKDKEK